MFVSLKNTKKGFTLIELLVVVAIIGVLSSVVLASLSTARQKSRDARRISDIGQIKVALELYFDAFATYPSTTPGNGHFSQYTTPCRNPVAGTDVAIQLLACNQFIQMAPTPPVGGSAKYVYRGLYSNFGAKTECNQAVNVACTSYALGVQLERNDNPVLLSDEDQAITAVAPTVGNFTGDAIDCVSGAAGADQCFDVKT